MNKRNLSTRQQKIYWLAAHPEFFDKPSKEIQKALIEAGMFSPKTSLIDLHLDRLVVETKAWVAQNPGFTVEQLTELCNRIGIVAAPVNMDVRKGHNDAARKLYSLCCSAPVMPIYRLNGIEMDGFECSMCLNRCEKVGCVPSFYESGK